MLRSRGKRNLHRNAFAHAQVSRHRFPYQLPHHYPPLGAVYLRTLLPYKLTPSFRNSLWRGVEDNSGALPPFPHPASVTKTLACIFFITHAFFLGRDDRYQRTDCQARIIRNSICLSAVNGRGLDRRVIFILLFFGLDSELFFCLAKSEFFFVVAQLVRMSLLVSLAICCDCQKLIASTIVCTFLLQDYSNQATVIDFSRVNATRPPTESSATV